VLQQSSNNWATDSAEALSSKINDLGEESPSGVRHLLLTFGYHVRKKHRSNPLFSFSILRWRGYSSDIGGLPAPRFTGILRLLVHAGRRHSSINEATKDVHPV
jgi:hypothetical protein